ncbi:hypothetical protein AORI_4337 [Amycolatopsis keratiniphila]|uniref:Uncharacterized protein n=1 Tax=Amycolatopsis keratiniphila TaxID=129921 RepID=R4T7K2_9PSEU|nr:hypothetical protein AORI_4337 [Amycolatopsis keratiniphila]
MDLRAEAVELLEAHDERPPPVGVDPVFGARHPHVVVNVDTLDAHLEHEHAAALFRIVLGEGVHGLDDGLHRHRAFRDTGRPDRLRADRGEPGAGELVRFVPVAAFVLTGRDRIGSGGQRQPVDGGRQRVGREIQNTFTVAHEILRRLGFRAQPEHASPAEPERRRHRGQVRGACLVDRRKEHHRRAEVEDSGLDTGVRGLGRRRGNCHVRQLRRLAHRRLARIGRRDQHRRRRARHRPNTYPLPRRFPWADANPRSFGVLRSADCW